MSYILDALKRADAERERGAVPGLHARQVTSPITRPASATPRGLGVALGVGMALAAIAAVLWAWHGNTVTPVKPDSGAALVATVPPPPPAPAPPASPAQAAPAFPAPAPQADTTQPPRSSPARAAQALPAYAPHASPSPVPTSPSLPPPDAALAQHVPTRDGGAAEPPAAAAPQADVAVAVPRPKQAGTAAVTMAKAPGSAAGTAAVPLLAELPEDTRRQIPALTITGTMYSENPAQRLLVVNNKVLNEGSQAAPEVTLDEIGPRSSVFSFRGMRFRLGH